MSVSIANQSSSERAILACTANFYIVLVVNKHIAFAGMLVLALVIATIGTLTYFATRTPASSPPPPRTDQYVADFDGCLQAGYPVQESYPRRCTAPDGRSFTDLIDNFQSGKVKTLSRDSYGLEKAQQIVVDDQIGYEKLWAELREKSDQAGQPPKIDFTTDIVIAVFAGSRTSGGHSIEIQDVKQKGSTSIVQVRETSPGLNCTSTPSITYPYHIVSYQVVPAGADPALYRKPFQSNNVDFVTETKTNNCFED